MTKRQRRTSLTAILIGLAATTAVVAAYVGGALERLELIMLDLRFRFTNSIQPGPDIVCLDITDRDLEAIGRWPWSRVQQAPLVAIPAEFGPKAILVDLTWTEHETARSPVLGDADILTRPGDLVRGEPLEYILPDLVLSHAIAAAGNVYLAYHHSIVDLERSVEFGELVELVLNDDLTGAARLASEIDARLRERIKNDQDYALQRPLDRARMVAALIRAPELDESQLAGQLGITNPRFLDLAFDRCHVAAMRWRLRQWLDADAKRWEAHPSEAVVKFYATLTDQGLTGDNSLKRAVIRAYRELLSYAATTAKPLAPLDRLAPITRPVDGIVPVHFAQARVARRCCFANFEPDVDGTVRRVALTQRHRDNLLSQLGFSVGWDLLGISPDGAVAEPGRLTLTPAVPSRGPLVIQIDERGCTVIPWVRGRDWTKQFRHVPASSVLRLHDLRRNAEHNRREAARFLELVFSSEFLPDFNEVAKLLSDRPRLECEAELERLQGEAELADFYEKQIRKIDEEAGRAERELRAFIERQRANLEREPDEAGGLSARLVDDVLYFLEQVDRLRAAEGAIRDEITDTKERLGSILQGSICVVGYTATSLADMVPTPTHPRVPGIMAHASLLNGLLSGRLVHWASTASNVVIAVAFGCLVALLSTFMQPRLASLLVAFMAVSYVALAGAVAFYQWTYWIALTPAVLATVAPFFAIAVYRYVFIDSERRQLATALGQYTSKEMARQMAENPELCKRAEMREVTAVFTDLKGFTGIAERIGAQRTQEVLNVCLGCFTEVMLRHEGMVNKFIGDGVFAFWNPVIYPQEDHARRACTTAVDLLDSLAELKAEQRRRGGDAAFEEIVLRIGIATGKAIVGPCGSEQKYDYTCIGDSVNVAARLESANKFYGTQILASGATREQGGEGFDFRLLGGVRVKGKRAAVPVFELLGRTGQVANDELEYADAFGQAVALFQQRQWRAALDAFEACRRGQPDDLVARVYCEATAALLADPPGDDWIGAIELTEK